MAEHCRIAGIFGETVAEKAAVRVTTTTANTATLVTTTATILAAQPQQQL